MLFVLLVIRVVVVVLVGEVVIFVEVVKCSITGIVGGAEVRVVVVLGMVIVDVFVFRVVVMVE